MEADGFKIIGEDEAFFMKNVGGELNGMVAVHVDDFLIAGKTKFVQDVIDMVSKNLKVSKVEWDRMRFTGVDIDASVPGLVKVNMDAYASTITKISTFRSSNPRELLNDIEVKLLRGYVGKLLWLSGNVRPDL